MADGFVGAGGACYPTYGDAAASIVPITPQHYGTEMNGAGQMCLYRYALSSYQGESGTELFWIRDPITYACNTEGYEVLPNAVPTIAPCDYQLDAEGIGYAFSWGFGAVVLLWSMGYAIGAALKVIRKI